MASRSVGTAGVRWRIQKGALSILDWIVRNKEWLFSGAGVVALTALMGLARKVAYRQRGPRSQAQSAGAGSHNFQAGRDVNINIAVPKDAARESPVPAADESLERMGALISQMRADLSEPQAEFVREFVVLPNCRVLFGGSPKLRFVYYEEEHNNLRGMLDVLEERGYVLDVTPAGKNVPIYRMTDKLVRYLIGK